jgi:TRAP-type uncharacterized transport system fused permease subunit
VPFIFLFNPSLALVSGTAIEKVVVIVFTFVAIYLAGIVFEGYALNNHLNFPVRLLAILGAVILVIPNNEFIHPELLILKTVVLLSVLSLIYVTTKKNKTMISEKQVA